MGIGFSHCVRLCRRAAFSGIFPAAAAAFLLTFATATTTPAGAVLTPVGPFAGAYSETWESFSNYQTGPSTLNFLPTPTNIMGGFASIANPLMAVYQPGAASFGLSSNGFAGVSDGAKAMGIDDLDSTTTITFDAPVTAFGAYWGAAEGSGAYTDDITVNFSDGSSAVFNHDPVPAGSGTLVWRGWSSTVPITSVSYTGDYIVIDGLQASVPEPASLGLFALAGAGMICRRKR
jgi:hypothetical protein